MSITPITPQPPTPPNGPSDWGDVVQGNCFTDGQRLGWWLGGTTFLQSGDDPSSYIWQLGNLGSPPGQQTFNDALLSFPTLYVIAHGWAPEYRAAVQAQNGNLLWWDSAASNNGRWASDWAWSPVGPLTKPPFDVSDTGLVQQILTMDPKATVVLYSWIDDSATESGLWTDFMAYRSEANTHMNGIRLANGLKQVVNPLFFKNKGKIHLIGHSHGSRVCTVAAMTLEQMGIPAYHLTILDSPESETTLGSNSANLLPHYLNQISIADPTGGSGTIVDCYTSCFGVNYASPSGNQPLDSDVVRISLTPENIYTGITPDYGDEHTYAAGWYSGSATQTGIGLSWPPFPATYQPALVQEWFGGVTPSIQWTLTADTSPTKTFVYQENPLTVTGTNYGNVTGDPASGLVFGPAASGWTTYSYFEGSFTGNNTDQYGFTFDLVWANPQVGDYFVIMAGDPSGHYTVFVLDGQSAPIGSTSVAVNSDVWWWTNTVRMYFLASNATPNDTVTVSNFQWMSVASSDGSLERAREEKIAAAKLAYPS